jgi:hypothetical protein
VIQWDAMHRRDLSGISWPYFGRRPPPREHRRDRETGARNGPALREDEQRQGRDHDHAGDVERCLLVRLPQSRIDRALVRGVERSTGKGHLARVPAHSVSPLDEQHVAGDRDTRSARLAEEHKNR